MLIVEVRAATLACEQRLQLFDKSLYFPQFIFNLLALEVSELLQAHRHRFDLAQSTAALVDVRIAGMHEQTRVRIVGKHGLI